ncbi:MAG: alginate lyase family protein, partial [Armatimonadota bacterium]
AMVEEGLDVREFIYLTFRLRAQASGERLTPMLMQRTERSAENPHGEITASARRHYLVLDFAGWREVSVPLAAFDGLGEIADRVEMINFSLNAGRVEPGPGWVEIDNVGLSVQPVGAVQPEQVPFPPADIAVEDEAEFFSLLDLDRPGLEGVRAAADARDWEAAKAAWAEHLATRTEPQWTWSRRDREQITALFEELFNGLGRYVPAADTVLERRFNFLGVPKQLDRDIDWLQGPVEWTHVLSRHHYWRTLGYAWWATGEAKYAEDLVLMLRDWVADNPVPRILTNARGEHGTVWRTLEAGIRGDVWFDVMELFMDAPQFDAEAVYLMTRSLVEHARHLHRYEVQFRYGNWQVVECTGLAAIGIMLPEFREAAEWRERAFEYLVEHMQRDVYPDGAHHELTPGYHGWVMQKFMKAARLAEINGYQVPGLMDRHERMFEFLMHLSKPDGRYPPLGDAGTGGSARGHLGLGALMYDRRDMRFLAVDNIEPSWVWLFGPQVRERYQRIEPRRPDFTSSMLPHAQYLMMRTGWERDDRFLLFDCAPWGGGHSHQDRLQVILYAGGRDLVIDPGIYSYDQPLSRTYFRGSEAHNILLIDEAEQLQSDPEVLAWATTDVADFASGRIAAGGLSHQRSVLFVRPDYWVVVDHLLGEGSHVLTRLFHLPQVEVEAAQRSARTAYPDGPNVQIAAADGATVEMREGWLPTGSAEAERAPVAAFVATETLPTALCVVLTPFEDQNELPQVERLPADEALTVRLRVSFADGQVDEIAIAPEPSALSAAGRSANARALLVRSGPRADGAYVHGGAE